MSKTISIVIPILNEAETIEGLLNYLLSNSNPKNIAEIIVVDGGSVDDSILKVESFIETYFPECDDPIYQDTDVLVLPNTVKAKQKKKAVQLIHSERGRAKQLNKGAAHATGSILYFLHADSFPPEYFDQSIIEEVEKGHHAGCFRMQFDSKHWWLRLASWLTKFSWRACRGGDQSQFITTELFTDIGGYDENYSIYEDNILINELFERDQFKVINRKLKSSARLYEKHGVWKLQYHFWAIYVKKWFGASAEELHAYYKKHIA